jgi:Flp pilus assembly protein TadB
MVPIHWLWQPILLSAVFVFILSSLIHMVLKYHSTDFKKLPDEDAAANALQNLKIPPGEYMYPYATSMKEMRTPEFQKKLERGPGLKLTLWPGGRPSMTGNLIQWFVYSVVIGIFCAYVAGRALTWGAPYLSVFRFVGVTAFCCYALAGWQESIWYKRAVSTSLKNTLDGLIYALVTAGTFGWLWPS